MRREVMFLGQEQPSTEPETGAPMPVPPLADIAGMPPARRSIGRRPDESAGETPRHAIRSLRGSVRGSGSAPAGLQALRSVATALLGAETLRLWAYQPA